MNQRIFGEWLRQKRMDAGYRSQGELSRACGVDHSTIARWERGDVRPNPENLKKLAPSLGVSYEEAMAAAGYLPDEGEPGGVTDYDATPRKTGRPGYFLEEQSGLRAYRTPPDSLMQIPLLTAISADIPISDQNSAGFIEFPTNIGADFAVRVADDGMSLVGIAPGDIAVCRNAAKIQVLPGLVVAASLEETRSITVRFYVEENAQKFLRAANPSYKDIPLDGKNCWVAGVVVKFLKESPTLADYERFLANYTRIPQEWISLVARVANVGLSPRDLEQYVEAVRKASLKTKE